MADTTDPVAAKIAEIRARFGARIGDVECLLGALEAGLTRHSRWDIHEGDYGEGPLLYSVCKECCAGGGGGQTEVCASDHDRVNCWPCPTCRDISAALLGEGSGRG